MNIDLNYKTLVKKILDEGYIYDDPNRKNVKRLEIPSYTFRHNFSDGFPAITLKKLAWKSVVTELVWFLKGDTNIKYLVDNGCNIWNKDAYNYYLKQAEGQPKEVILTFEEWLNEIKDGEDLLGDLGKVYGHYWRNLSRRIPTGSGHYKLEECDQIVELIKGLKEKPLSTEHIVTARNPLDKDSQTLPCCHYGFQIVMRPLTPLECGEYGIVSGEHNGIRHSGYGFELHWNQRSCDLFLGKIWELLK